MSNIRNGKVIAEDEDAKLIYHGGHVYHYGRIMCSPLGLPDELEPMPTNTWREDDFGTPQEAARGYPGLYSQLMSLEN